MRESRDQNNVTIVRNYVEMPERLQFSALEVASATGTHLQTCRNLLNLLAKDGVIVRLPKRTSGRTYYRKAEAKEGLLASYVAKGAAAVAREMGISRQTVYNRTKQQGLTPIATRMTCMQLRLLTELADGSWHDVFVLKASDTLKRLVNKGLAERQDKPGMAHYRITDKGSELLRVRCQVSGVRCQGTGDRPQGTGE